MVQLLLGLLAMPILFGLLLSFSGMFKQGILIGFGFDLIIVVGIYLAIKLSSTFSKQCEEKVNSHFNETK